MNTTLDTTPNTEGFALIRQETYEYNEAHQVIRATHANGKTITTDWICSGPLSVIDENGLTTIYQYNSAKQLAQVIRQPVSILPEYQTEANEYPIPPVQEHTTYNGIGLPLVKTTTQGDTVTQVRYTYDHTGRLLSQTDPMGLTTTWEYSDDGLTTTKTIPTGATYITRQHSSGAIISELGTGQQHKYYTYSVSGSGISTTIHLDSTNGFYSMKEENSWGQIVYSEDHSCRKYYYHNEQGKLCRIMTNESPLTDDETIEYDPLGQPIRHTSHFNFYPEELSVYQRSTEWDYKYTLLALPDLGYNSDTIPLPFYQKTTRTYSETGQPIESIEQEYVGTHLYKDIAEASLSIDKYGVKTLLLTEDRYANTLQTTLSDTFEGDIQNVSIANYPLRKISPYGDESTYHYTFTPQGVSITQRALSNLVETKQYNLNAQELTCTRNDTLLYTNTYSPTTGTLIRKTHSDDSYEAYQHDHRGRVSSQYGTAIHPCRYQYDDQDNLVALHTFRTIDNEEADPWNTPGGDITRWTYDPIMGVLLNKEYPDGSSHSWEYDFRKRITIERLPDGNEITYEYGAYSDEPTRVLYSDGTPSVIKTYNHLGQLLTVTDAGGCKSFEYNQKGDTTTENISGTIPQSFHYTRDALGRVTTTRLDHDGATLHEEATQFDSLGRIESLHIDGLDPFTYTYSYAKSSLLEELSYPFACNKKITYQDNTLLPSQITYEKKNRTPLYTQTLTRNDRDLITGIENRTPERTLQNTYQYNTRDELNTYNHPEDTDGNITTLDYDTIGNRLYQEDNNRLVDFSTNNLNQYTRLEDTDGIYSPTYDARGNQTTVKTSTGLWTVTYDLNDRPIIFTQGNKQIKCLYDSKGRRVEKEYWDNQTLQYKKRYTYQGFLLVAEWDTTSSTPSLTRTYHWDPTEPTATRPLIMRKWEGDSYQTYTYLHTQNKNVSHLLDEEGNTVASYTYDAFGNITEQSGAEAASNPFRFSSEYHDAELGLIYYNYRHYNPTDGRWICREPLGEKESKNLYAFVGNSTLSRIDYLGLEKDKKFELALLLGLKISWGSGANTSYSTFISPGVQYRNSDFVAQTIANISYRINDVGSKIGGESNWDLNLIGTLGYQGGSSDKNWKLNLPSSDVLSPFGDNSRDSTTIGYINNTRLSDGMNTHYWLAAFSIGNFRLQTHNDTGFGTDRAHTSSGEIGYGLWGIGWDIYTGAPDYNKKPKTFEESLPGNWTPSSSKFEYFFQSPEELSYNRSRWYARCKCSENINIMGEIWDNGWLQNMFHTLIGAPGFQYSNKGYDFRGGIQLTL